MKENSDSFLEKELEWSMIGDKLFFEKVNGMPSFLLRVRKQLQNTCMQ